MLLYCQQLRLVYTERIRFLSPEGKQSWVRLGGGGRRRGEEEGVIIEVELKE